MTAETWDNSGASSVLFTPSMPLTTSRAQEARSMAKPQSTKPPVTAFSEAYIARFWSYVDKAKQHRGCWLWRGTLNAGGYGMFSAFTRNYQAHRVAYELVVGKIPDGLQIDHLCRVRGCVNPQHLEPVTNRENVLRGIGFAAINARKKYCPRGHALSGSNIRVPKTGGRVCRECDKRLWRAQERRRKREELAAAAASKISFRTVGYSGPLCQIVREMSRQPHGYREYLLSCGHLKVRRIGSERNAPRVTHCPKCVSAEMANMKIETRDVLAGAYLPNRRRDARMLSHAVVVDGRGALVQVLCRRISIDSLAGRNASDPNAPPTCERCIQKLARLPHALLPAEKAETP